MKKILIILLLLMCSTSYSVNYYISTTGVDTATGYLGFPKKTLASVFSNYDLGNSDIIYVAAGTYNEKNIVVGSNDDGFTIQGDFFSNGIPTSIFSSDANGRWLLIGNTANDNITINDITIKNYKEKDGGSPGGGGAIKQIAGAINLKLNNLVFDTCSTNTGSNLHRGGALYSAEYFTITNCVFKSCYSESFGGAISYEFSPTAVSTISKSTFYSNNSTNYGSAVYSGIVSNATFVLNIVNSLFYSNGLTNGAGTIVAETGKMNVTNCTVTTNGNSSNGVGGLYAVSSAVMSVKNSIVYNNTGSTYPDAYANSASMSFNNCCYGNASKINTVTTTSCIIANPLFLGSGTYPYYLQGTSTCIDKGTPTGAPSDDITSSGRIGNPDIGAYESAPCPGKTTWNGTAWSNGVPDTSTRVTLSGNYNTLTNGNIDACNMVINSGVTLTIPDNTYVYVINSITNSGNNIVISSKGSLIQVNSGSTGNPLSGNAIDVSNITLTKTTSPEYRWDYVYWSKFIKSGDIFITPINTAFDIKYYWDPSYCATIDRSYLGWRGLSGEPTLGTGFIARVMNISPYNTTSTPISVTFTGTSTNGDYSTNVIYYDSNDSAFKNYVLLGNPYPGALDFTTFYNDNSTKIFGTAYLWTSYTNYSGSGEYSQSDYASFNLTGGLTGASTQSPNSSISVPNGYIASGQGFCVRVKQTGSVTFKNSHRSKVINSNSQFFRTSSVSDKDTNSEKDRYWLRITDNSNKFREMLIGYIEGATSDLDDAYDGVINSTSKTKFYSISNDTKLSIQGKGVFDRHDTIKLGYEKSVVENEILKIEVTNKEGVFNNQKIYLKDNITGKLHDLSTPYTFNATLNDVGRFEVVYRSKLIENVDTFDYAGSIIVTNSMIYSSVLDIKSIELYDITGRLILSKDNINYDEYNFNKVYSQVMIVKVLLENGELIIKKVII